MIDSQSNSDASPKEKSLSDAQPSARRSLSRRKKLAYSLVTTLLFFVLLESGLALLGVEPAVDLSDPFVGFDDSSPLFVPDTASGTGDASRMVTSKNKLAWFNEQSFPRRKPPDTRRVFCLGGSTTYGRPYDDTTSFPGWLRELLPHIAPQARWEVINAGGVSYASYRVARLTQELVQYEPDLLIVYTGHNEFLEDRTYGEIRHASPLQRGALATLARSRTAALAQRMFGGPSSDRHGGRFQLSDDVDTVLDHTVGPTTYQRDVEQRRRIIEHFEVNLSRIVAIARESGAQVVLVTPASNLKDGSPFKSQHAEGVSAETRLEWTRHYETARKHELDGHLDKALLAYTRAAEIDSSFAELHWRTGRLLLKQKQFEQARSSFARSIDEDVCPLRAVSEIPRIIRSTAERLNVPLVDFEQLVGEQCRAELGHSSPGEEVFLDHVHPTIAANGQLAKAIVDRLVGVGIVETDSAPTLTEEVLANVSRQINSRVDERKHAIALRNLAKVLNWAGKHLEAGSLAMRAVEQLPDDPECLVLSAAYLSETGRIDKAIEHYRLALQHRPDYATAHQMLGSALVDRGQLDEALGHFRKLARLRPDDSHAWQMIGAIYAEQQQFDAALPNFETALALNGDDSNIHYNLANALGHLGRREDAIKHYTRAVELNADDADARNNLGVMLMQAGRSKKAARQFREVLRLRPEDKIAAANLLDVEAAKQGRGFR
jgi:tetratricopeptide (TPR) repeat protein